MIKNVYEEGMNSLSIYSSILGEVRTFLSTVTEIKIWYMVNRSFVDERGHFSFNSGLQLSFEDIFDTFEIEFREK